jgi:uncharacterized protein (TIGR03437 family)
MQISEGHVCVGFLFRFAGKKVKPVACLLVIVLLGILCASGLESAAQELAGGPAAGPLIFVDRSNVPKYVPDELLVRFRPGIEKSQMVSTHATMGAEVITEYRSVKNLQRVRLPFGMHVEEAVLTYQRHPDVLYAEPNYIVWAEPTNPNDPNFTNGTLWGLHNDGTGGGTPDADIDSPEAWDTTTGSNNVIVTVIDTGVDYNHPDLAANMIQLETNCSDGVDNDGNGRIDDCRGIDTANSDNDPFDDNGHGTHVSGTIGAVGNNGVGVVGVNWIIKLMACKFLTAGGSGSTAGAIGCLDYVALMKDRGVNIFATSNSWGGGPFAQSLFDAIDAQRQRGILFIAAAGNAGTDNDIAPHYPSNYYLPNIIAVAATDRNDLKSSFSQFGRHTVHIGAPGSSIMSTVPTGSCSICDPSGYTSISGTSMATPHVTGVAALLKAQDPSRDWKKIKNLVLAGGDNISALATNTVTGKRLNAAASLNCLNRIVTSRIRPIGNNLSAITGIPIDLALLNINCADPNGDVQITGEVGSETVTLRDNGQGRDEEANDGIYSGQWSESVPGTYNLTFPGSDVVTITVNNGYGVASRTLPYRTITGTNLNFGDDSAAQITSPFPIQFGESTFTNVFISSNGHINFDGLSTDFSNEAIPSNDFNTVVAPFWDDLVAGGTGSPQNVFWQVTGSAPNRELVVEWRDVYRFTCAASETVKFQVVFTENSSTILFNYLDSVFGGGCTFADRGGSATIGVQTSSTAGTPFSFDTPSLNQEGAEVDVFALEWKFGGGPNINAGGTVNGASFTSQMAAGAIVSTFGTNMALSTAFAGAVPLPTTLGGATLQINDLFNVPKFFASATQINHQLPWELAGQSQASMTDTVGLLRSGARDFNLSTHAPGLFATNQAGTGQGAILISGTGGRVAAPVGMFPGSRPANRGEFIEIFCTGLGPVTNTPATGSAAGSSPLSLTTSAPTVTIGGVPATVSFSGLAPGFVGLYQVNVQVPATAPTGSAVAVVLTIGGVTANTVTIAVQ